MKIRTPFIPAEWRKTSHDVVIKCNAALARGANYFGQTQIVEFRTWALVPCYTYMHTMVHLKSLWVFILMRTRYLKKNDRRDQTCKRTYTFNRQDIQHGFFSYSHDFRTRGHHRNHFFKIFFKSTVTTFILPYNTCSLFTHPCKTNTLFLNLKNAICTGKYDRTILTPAGPLLRFQRCI